MFVDFTSWKQRHNDEIFIARIFSWGDKSFTSNFFQASFSDSSVENRLNRQTKDETIKDSFRFFV